VEDLAVAVLTALKYLRADCPTKADDSKASPHLPAVRQLASVNVLVKPSTLTLRRTVAGYMLLATELMLTIVRTSTSTGESGTAPQLQLPLQAALALHQPQAVEQQSTLLAPSYMKLFRIPCTMKV